MGMKDAVRSRVNACYIPLALLLNCIVALLSLILIVVMGHALNDPDVYLHLTRPYLDALEEDLMKYHSQVKIDRKAVDYLVFTRSIIKVKLVLDAFVVACCVMGTVGVLLQKKPMVLVYVLFMFMLFLAEVNLLILTQGSPAALNSQRVVMKGSLQDHYEGLFSQEPTSVMWNSIMIGAGCCGVDGHRDFHNAYRWRRSRNISLKGVAVPVRGDMPLACCKRDAARRVSYILNSYEPPPNLTSPHYDPWHPALKELACSGERHDDGNNKDNGCYAILMHLAEYLTNSAATRVCDLVSLACAALAMVLCMTAVVLDSGDQKSPPSSLSRPEQDAPSRPEDEDKPGSSRFLM